MRKLTHIVVLAIMAFIILLFIPDSNFNNNGSYDTFVYTVGA